MAQETRGGGRGTGGPEVARAKAAAVPRESPRVAIPSVLMQALQLIERNLEEGPSPDRALIRALCWKLHQAYPYLRYPWGPANSSELEQDAAEARGEEQDYGF